jgi:hypothetical protein
MCILSQKRIFNDDSDSSAYDSVCLCPSSGQKQKNLQRSKPGASMDHAKKANAAANAAMVAATVAEQKAKSLQEVIFTSHAVAFHTVSGCYAKIPPL